MENPTNLLLDLAGGILTITINREKALNALNIKTLEEIRDAMQTVYDDPEITGVIITGAGEKAFVAGADISEFSGVNEVTGRKFSEQGQEIFQMIESCNKPVIAAVNGFALGGGCELAMACHIRIATENAKFGQPEVNLGIIPGYGGTQRMTHLIGKGKAVELMMTAEIISAKMALQLGLANHVVATHDELISKSIELLNTIAQKAPLAIGMVIDCVNAVHLLDEDGYQMEANSFYRCAGSQDFKEGAAAFMEKRAANFKGE